MSILTALHSTLSPEECVEIVFKRGSGSQSIAPSRATTLAFERMRPLVANESELPRELKNLYVRFQPVVKRAQALLSENARSTNRAVNTMNLLCFTGALTVAFSNLISIRTVSTHQRIDETIADMRPFVLPLLKPSDQDSIDILLPLVNAINICWLIVDQTMSYDSNRNGPRCATHRIIDAALLEAATEPELLVNH